MRRLRAAGIVVGVAIAVAAVVTIAADRERRGSGPRDAALPSFALGYHCTDARDEFASSALRYDLRLEDGRWVAYITAEVSREGLRAPCRVDFGVPAGSRDVRTRALADRGDRVVTLARHGSASAGTASVQVRPRYPNTPASEVLTLDVALPDDRDVSHSLGLGLYFFRFELFGSGEAGSFRNGRVAMHLPEGHSLVQAAPDPGDGPPEWALTGGRDQEILVTYRHDVLRTAAEVASETLFVALGLLLTLLWLPARARPRPETVPEPEPPPPPPPPPMAKQPPPPPPRVEKPKRRRFGLVALLAVPVLGEILRRRFRR